MAQPGLRRLLFAIGYGTTANLFLHYNRSSPQLFFFCFQISDDRPTWSCMQRCGNIFLIRIRKVLAETKFFRLRKFIEAWKIQGVGLHREDNIMMDGDDMVPERPVGRAGPGRAGTASSYVRPVPPHYRCNLR